VTLTECSFTPVSPSADAIALEGEDRDGMSSNLWPTAPPGEGGGDAVGMNHNAWTAYNAVDFDGLRSVASAPPRAIRAVPLAPGWAAPLAPCSARCRLLTPGAGTNGSPAPPR
jgi:hypothetical protein